MTIQWIFSSMDTPKCSDVSAITTLIPKECLNFSTCTYLIEVTGPITSYRICPANGRPHHPTYQGDQIRGAPLYIAKSTLIPISMARTNQRAEIWSGKSLIFCSPSCPYVTDPLLIKTETCIRIITYPTPRENRTRNISPTISGLTWIARPGR